MLGKFLMNPSQYEHGVCNNDNMLLNSGIENILLSWQLMNSSCTHVNKLFVAINTVKGRVHVNPSNHIDNRVAIVLQLYLSKVDGA